MSKQDELRKLLEEITIGKILDDSFLSSCTKFGTLADFESASPLSGKTDEEFAKFLTSREWDAWIKENTIFSDWQSMLVAAANKRAEIELAKV